MAFFRSFFSSLGTSFLYLLPVIRVLITTAALLFLFYLGMFVANILVSLLSVAIDFLGIVLAAISQINSFWYFVITVIDAGWVYFLLALGVTMVIMPNLSWFRVEGVISAILAALIIINVYDDCHFAYSFFGETEYFRNECGATIWRSVDILNMDLNISEMRYIVFDIAVGLGMVIPAFNDEFYEDDFCEF